MMCIIYCCDCNRRMIVSFDIMERYIKGEDFECYECMLKLEDEFFQVEPLDIGFDRKEI